MLGGKISHEKSVFNVCKQTITPTTWGRLGSEEGEGIARKAYCSECVVQ